MTARTSDQTLLICGLAPGILAWMAILALAVLRSRAIPWFSVSYNLPISLAFLALATHMGGAAFRMGIRRYAREQGLVMVVWAIGVLLLYLRLVTQSIDISGHMTWTILMGSQSSAMRLPTWFTLFVWATAIHVLLLKLFVLGGQSGQWGLVAGVCLGAAVWFAVRGRTTTRERGLSG